MGTFQVHEPHYANFSLRNNSDCVLQYTLSVRMITPDSLDDAFGETSQSDWRTGAESAVSSVVVSSDGSPSQGTPAMSSRRSRQARNRKNKQGQPLAQVFELDFPSGTIQARSNKKISLRFKAQRPVPYKFCVVCSYDLQGLASAMERANHSSSNSSVRVALERRIQAAELVVSAQGGFPKVLLVDARMENALNSDLVGIRRQLSVQAINFELSSPLTPLERTLHTNPEEVKAFTARELIKML
jgi:hypothetical protein